MHREEHGFPHWVIYDEAHLLGSHEEARWARRGGCVLSSFTPALLPAHEIDRADVVLELTNADTAGELASKTVRRAAARFGAGPSRAFTIAERRIAHVRHRHKYADVSLPRERRFYFRPVDGQVIAAAGTMDDFRTSVGHLDPRVLQYHLERGDFSRWLDDTIADKELAGAGGGMRGRVTGASSREPGTNTSPASLGGRGEVSRFTQPRLTDRAIAIAFAHCVYEVGRAGSCSAMWPAGHVHVQVEPTSRPRCNHCAKRRTRARASRPDPLPSTDVSQVDANTQNSVARDPLAWSASVAHHLEHGVVLGHYIGNKITYSTAAGRFCEVAQHCCRHTPKVILVRHHRDIGDISVVRAYIVRDADQSVRFERTDRTVGGTLFDQLARERMQKPGVDDKEPVLAVTIGEVTMKRDHRIGVMFV